MLKKMISVITVILLIMSMPMVPAYALYVEPTNSFITDSSETRKILNISTGTLSDVQKQLDDARSADANSVIILNLTGTYTVSNSPLSLPSNTCLVLNGSINADSSTTASSLISVNSQSKVSIACGTINGNNSDLYGIYISNSGKVNIDKVTVTNCGKDNIYFSGKGNSIFNTGSTITRCNISNSKENGITVKNATNVLCIDNKVYENAGTGIDMSSANSSLTNNICSKNSIGINVHSNNNLISGNTCSENDSVGLKTSSDSLESICISNKLTANAVSDLSIDGTRNTFYANEISNTANIPVLNANNYVVANTTGFDVSNCNYFYPPTINNRHTDTSIVKGLGRTDLSISSTTINDVQQQYDTARNANPGNVIVLNLTGTITLVDKPLTLSSNTCVILDGTIDSAAVAGKVAISASSAKNISVSGGTIEGHKRALTGVEFNNCSVAIIDSVTLYNCGDKSVRTSGGALHMSNATVPGIINGCKVDNCGGRGIWTQNSSGRYIVMNNYLTNCQMDGIDFDSHTKCSVAINNQSVNNTRYGLFFEEGDMLNFGVNNILDGNSRGLNIYANVSGPTQRNIAFCNTIINTHGTGIRVGSLLANQKESNENFLFNNILSNNTTEISIESIGKDNYLSQNVILTNGKIVLNPGSYDFFNPVSSTPIISGAATSQANTNGWYNSDVTVHFTAKDSGAGVAYVTPDITLANEGANQTVTGFVYDKAGNMASATVSGINIDKTAPEITVNIPDASEYLLNQKVIINWTAVDKLSVTDTVYSTYNNGQAIDTGTVGKKTIIIDAADKASNKASKTITYFVRYNYTGVLNPLNNDGTSVFMIGRDIPVKFQLKDIGGKYVSTAAAELYLIKPDGSEIKAQASGNSNTDNKFRYDNNDSQYVFNMTTKGLTAGIWKLKIVLDDGTSKYVQVTLKTPANSQQ